VGTRPFGPRYGTNGGQHGCFCGAVSRQEIRNCFWSRVSLYFASRRILFAMSHLIEVIDNALDPELCQQWLAAFDSSPHQSTGKTGGGVDTEKKRSRDINVTGRTEFRSLLKPVTQATTRGIMHYMHKHPLAMISGLGLKLAHPVSSEVVSVTIDNFAEVAEPQLPLLLQ